MELFKTIMYYWGVACLFGFAVSLLVFGPGIVRFFLEEYSLILAFELGESYRAKVAALKRFVRPLLTWYHKSKGQILGILYVVTALVLAYLGIVVAYSPL